MQSWGTRSRFDVRDTGAEPSKSGVVGLLAAALGRSRDESVVDLAALRMGVRIDRPGVMMRDFHTAQNVLKANRSGRHASTLSERFYLADAAFSVGLEHDDRQFLCDLHAAMLAPRWPLFLGRRAFVPDPPVVRSLAESLRDEDLVTALKRVPRNPADPLDHRQLVIESSEPTSWRRFDQPVGKFRDREFAPRFVHLEMIDVSVPTQA